MSRQLGKFAIEQIIREGDSESVRQALSESATPVDILDMILKSPQLDKEMIAMDSGNA